MLNVSNTIKSILEIILDLLEKAGLVLAILKRKIKIKLHRENGSNNA